MTQNTWLARAAQRCAEDFINEVAGAQAVIFSSADGFSLAHASKRLFEPGRFAAMASSITAIGDVIGQEAGLGTPSGFIIDADNGYMAMKSVRREEQVYVLNVWTTRDAMLGLVLHKLDNIAKALASV